MRDEKVKWNFAYRSGHYSRRDYSPSFMEFVHRQEERQEHDDQQIKKLTLNGTSIPADTPGKRAVERPSVPLLSLADLLLAGTLMFLFITLLLLIMN